MDLQVRGMEESVPVQEAVAEEDGHAPSRGCPMESGKSLLSRGTSWANMK